MSNECKFSKAWIGTCKKPADESGFCEEHKGQVCCSCGKQATHDCAETMQFVCGFFLCDDCEHTIQSNGRNSGGNLPDGLRSHCRKEDQVYKPAYMRANKDDIYVEGKEPKESSELVSAAKCSKCGEQLAIGTDYKSLLKIEVDTCPNCGLEFRKEDPKLDNAFKEIHEKARKMEAKLIACYNKGREEGYETGKTDMLDTIIEVFETMHVLDPTRKLGWDQASEHVSSLK